ncbi:MAG: hypothetical protein WDN24_10470 [Sphingomonas sp.]
MADAPRPLIGLVAGIAAGLVASAAIAAFEAQAAKPGGDEAGAEPEDAGPPPPRNTVHFIAGAVLGGIYGVLAEYRPEARTGFGGAYGAATSALLDAGLPADAEMARGHGDQRHRPAPRLRRGAGGRPPADRRAALTREFKVHGSSRQSAVLRDKHSV